MALSVNLPPSLETHGGMERATPVCPFCLPYPTEPLSAWFFFLDPYLNLFTFVRRTRLSALSAIRESAPVPPRNRRDVPKWSGGERIRAEISAGRDWIQHVYLIVFRGLPEFLSRPLSFYIFKADVVVVYPGDRRLHLSSTFARFPSHTLPMINLKKSEVKLRPEKTDARKIRSYSFGGAARVHPPSSVQTVSPGSARVRILL